MKYQINKLALLVFFTTFYFPNPSFGFDIGGALKSLGEGIADTGKNQSCREVIDDYGDSEIICEPNENQQSEGIKDNAKGSNQDNITDELKALTEEGKKLLSSGHFGEAIGKWKEAIRFKPDYAFAHHGLGTTYIKIKRYDEGIASLKEAIRLKADLAKSHQNLGTAYLYLKRYEEGIASLKEVIHLKPDFGLYKTYNNVGFAYIALGKYKDAMPYLKNAVRLYRDDPNTENKLGITYGNLGIVYSKFKRWDEALVALKKAIQLKPDYAKAHHNLAMVYSELKRFDETLVGLKKTIRLKPDYALAHYNLGVSYNMLGQYQDAIASFKEALRIQSDLPYGHQSLGAVYITLKRWDKALVVLQEAVKLQPNSARVNGGLGIVYDALGKGSLAIKYMKKAKELYKSQGDTYNVSKTGHNLRIYYNKYEGKNQPQPVVEQPTRATGTGFLLGSSNYIITNYHVVKGFNSLQVNFLSGEKSKAKLRANDKANDVAVLELLNPPNLTTNSMVLGDSSSVEMGEKVFTIGYPVSGVLGKKPKYAEGVISSTTGISDDPRMFQITVPIQPGNSGGPLFNNKGEVIGITTSSLDALKAFEIMGAIPQNVNFAVKSDYVKALLQSIPDSMTSTRSIVVVPSDLETRVSGLIKQVKNNIVLVEASTDNSLPAFVELDDAKSNPVVETKRKVDLKEKVRLAKKRQAEIDDRFKTLKEMESLDDSLISIEEKQEAIKKFIKDYPDRNPRLEEAQQMLELIVQ